MDPSILVHKTNFNTPEFRLIYILVKIPCALFKASKLFSFIFFQFPAYVMVGAVGIEKARVVTWFITNGCISSRCRIVHVNMRSPVHHSQSNLVIAFVEESVNKEGDTDLPVASGSGHFIKVTLFRILQNLNDF